MTDDDAADSRGPATRPGEHADPGEAADAPSPAQDVAPEAPIVVLAAAAAPAPAPAPTSAPSPTTAGGLIRAAREAQGIDLGSLAAILKIPMKKLEALEADRHGELPGATFERALAQAACRALHIDSRDVLALMPQGGNTLERVTGGLNTPFRERQGPRVDLGEATSLLRPVVLLPALLLIAALALFFLPSSLWHRVSRQAVDAVGDASSAASAPAFGASTPGVSVTPVDLGASQGENGSSPDAASAPSSAAASTAVVATLPVPPASAAPAPAPGASAAAPAALAAAPAPVAIAPSASRTAAAAAALGVPITVTTTQQSWIEASDAQGRTLISRTVAAGESVGLEGAMPIKLRIGNARGTVVTLRGENVDLTPWVRDNIARLQLK